MVAPREEIVVGDYAEGETIEVEMHNGGIIRLKKLGRDHDPRSRIDAIRLLEQAQREQLFMTGLVYYEEPRAVLSETLNLPETPLAQLGDEKLRPTKDALDNLMKAYM